MERVTLSDLPDYLARFDLRVVSSQRIGERLVVWVEDVRDDALLQQVQGQPTAHKTEGSDAETLDVLEM